MSKVNAGSILSVAKTRVCIAGSVSDCLPFLFVITSLPLFLYRLLNNISCAGFYSFSDDPLLRKAGLPALQPSDFCIFDQNINTTINISPYCIIFNSEERRCCRGETA